MEIKNSAIIDKAAGIILDTGLETLTIQNLALKLNVQENHLHNQISKDEDIILTLLRTFEVDLNELIKEIKTQKSNPESELKSLFKGLHSLFLQKPYYLSLVFDKSLINKEEDVKKSVLHIKHIAEDYLTNVINNGKKDNTFKTKRTTKSLVKKILSGFGLIMKDEQRMNEMIPELKKLKILND
ncbi:MAG: hypothetical protein RBS38_06380 [Bacteroidales bacterium]|jgi:hypothetical protein|nr:hypothetical protein [Bacteroidales bacterium]